MKTGRRILSYIAFLLCCFYLVCHCVILHPYNVNVVQFWH